MKESSSGQKELISLCCLYICNQMLYNRSSNTGMTVSLPFFALVVPHSAKVSEYEVNL